METEIKINRGHLIGEVVKCLEKELGEKLDFKKGEMEYRFVVGEQTPSLKLPRQEIYETFNGTTFIFSCPERKNIVGKIKIIPYNKLDVTQSCKALKSIGAIKNA